MEVLGAVPLDRSFPDALADSDLMPFRPVATTVLQVNVGKKCNQTCRHCHVDAGPERREIMTRQTMAQCLLAVDRADIPIVDITGGAPEMNPDLNGPIVAYVASEQAGFVNGQVFGRRGYSYTLFQTPKPLAAMFKEGGWEAGEIAKNFDAAFGEHLSVPGIQMTPALKAAAAATAAKKG